MGHGEFQVIREVVWKILFAYASREKRIGTWSRKERMTEMETERETEEGDAWLDRADDVTKNNILT